LKGVKKRTESPAGLPSAEKTKPLCLFGLFRVAFLEPFDPSGGVNELLFPGVERVTFIADFDVPAGDGGAGFYDIAAGAGEFRVRVPRMDFFFHGCLSKDNNSAVL
jgi:hypothetical protein